MAERLSKPRWCNRLIHSRSLFSSVLLGAERLRCFAAWQVWNGLRLAASCVPTRHGSTRPVDTFSNRISAASVTSLKTTHSFRTWTYRRTSLSDSAICLPRRAVGEFASLLSSCVLLAWSTATRINCQAGSSSESLSPERLPDFKLFRITWTMHV